jgi:cell filamentation protein
MNRLFATLPSEIEAATADAFVPEAARFPGDLYAIHPFQEGNGRSQLSFTAMLGERAGYQLDFARVRRNTFLPAMIASYVADLAPFFTELRYLLH